MKYSPSTHLAARTVAGCLAATMIALAGNSVIGDDSDHIINAESEHIVDGEVPHVDPAAPANSYVGDMPIHDGSGGNGGMVIGRGYGRPDLFYNYYTQGHANRTNAQMYLSPLPIPPNVGHTFYTYQPWYPHHMMYWHKDRYHRYYDNGRGMNRTRAVYYSPPLRQAASNLYWNFLRIPR